MRGSVAKRGKTWSYVVDVGRDPRSGRRRQRWKGGFATKRDAEHALGRATAEIYKPKTDDGGTDANDGRAVRYLEWTWDPDPTDTSVQTGYAFVLRAADGSVDVVHSRIVTASSDATSGCDCWASAGSISLASRRR